MNKHVVALCGSGLGNRICSIIGAQYIAEKSGSEFKIVWIPNHDCDCEYKDIFHTKHHTVFSVTDIINKYWCLEFSQKIKIEQDLNQWSTKLSAKFNNCILYGNCLIPDYIKNKFITRCLSEYSLNPLVKSNYKQAIHDLSITENDYGIHIRSTDGKHFMHNDVDHYYTFIKNNSDKRFFVMSDEKEIEDKFMCLDNVICTEKSEYPEYRSHANECYRNKQSVVTSFVDLLVLSRTKIINTSASSFLKVAYLYKDVDINSL
jgi:hypothetical protein